MSGYKSFGDLRMDAVQAFVRTAILIDNEPRAATLTPVGEEPAAAAKEPPKTATSVAFGAAPAAQGQQPPTTNDPNPPAAEAPAVIEIDGIHQLPVQPVTNAFAGRQITCGFYFPANDDPDVVQTALAAARHVDATIVDWQLRPGDAGPAKELIAALIADDRSAGGRMRLIVVYTGERGLDAECAKLQDHLKAAGIDDFETTDQGRALKSRHALITFANKPARGDRGLEVPGSAARPVGWNDLPVFVLEAYGQLSEGLLQSFALKSIGAVRDDTHHLLSVFSPELDGAYLAQRAGIGAPTDAEEMMTALLTAEFATSIVDRGIEGQVLGGDAAALALTVREPPEEIKVKEYKTEAIYEKVVQQPQGGGRHIKADKASLESLLRTGLDTSVVRLSDDPRKKLDRQFFATDADAQRVLSRFARLATFTREVDEARRLGRDDLALTGGTIVRSVVPSPDGQTPPVETYLLCVQPGCDAVRLTGDVAFPFCPLAENSSAFDLIVRSGGTERSFKVDRRPRSLRLVTFAAEPKKQVVVSTRESGVLGFWSADKATFWEFVAELRALEAQHFTTLLVGKFNRVPLNGSEWLRLHRVPDGD